MLEWTIVASLIAFGLILLIAEVIFIPGSTVVGLVGFVFLAVGVGLSFKYFGQSVGWLTFGGSAVFSVVLFYFAFKSNVWKAFSLKTAITSKVNEGQHDGLDTGLEGLTISDLRPIGKAQIGEKMYEVKTRGTFVEAGKPIRILEISSNQIIVEPIL